MLYYVKALYDFEAGNSEELSFREVSPNPLSLPMPHPAVTSSRSPHASCLVRGRSPTSYWDGCEEDLKAKPGRNILGLFLVMWMWKQCLSRFNQKGT